MPLSLVLLFGCSPGKSTIPEMLNLKVGDKLGFSGVYHHLITCDEPAKIREIRGDFVRFDKGKPFDRLLWVNLDFVKRLDICP